MPLTRTDENAPAADEKVDAGLGPRKTSKATVTVACKIETGVILQICRPMTTKVPSGRPGEMIEHTQNYPMGPKIAVRGPKLPYGMLPNFKIVGGFALTPGVPEEFWEHWLEQHKNDPMVENGLIYAHSREDYLEDYANDHASVKSGMQGLDISVDGKGQLTDKRIPRRRDMKIETADEMKDRQAGGGEAKPAFVTG